MGSGKHYVLAAGGTGGHMVPAAALAAELMRRGHKVALLSDARDLVVKPAIAALPTITPIGMAALLPHRELSIRFDYRSLHNLL